MTTLEFVAYLVALVFGAPLLGVLILAKRAPVVGPDQSTYYPRPDSEVQS